MGVREAVVKAMAKVLATDEASRLGRATEQGFDISTPRYHGTSKDKDFTKFSNSRHGTWTTTDPNEASGYAIQNDSKSFRLTPGGGYNLEPVNSASRVIPLYARPPQNPYVVSEQGYPDWVRSATNYKKANSDWFDQLRSQGHDAVDLGGGVRVDFNNANLRGQFAPFDPANVGKPVIMGGVAGAVAAPVVGAAMGSTYDQGAYQEPDPMQGTYQ